MTLQIVLIAIMAVAVAVLLGSEQRGRRDLVLVAKPLASVCFVLLAAMRLQGTGAYGLLVVLALALCLVGDVCLIFPQAFLAGLAVFLLGHVAYAVAFASVAPPRGWSVPFALAVAAAGVAAVRWLWPYLGDMRVPVLAYVVVISVMVWGALSAARAGAVPVRVAVGAGLFYLSDLTVARDRFVKLGFVNRAWGLPAYYGAQVLLALSV